jgi:hypothetical protein
MALQYDQFSNVIGEYESEEERLRREEEERRRLEAEKPVKQTVTINPDGTRDVTISGSASALQGGAMPQQVEPKMAATAPVNPATYNASIAQQESGANPNIGFHDRTKSTAFGPYGMTTAAWQDARRRDPSLPEDITKATPAQLTAGQTGYTQENAGYLKNYGVPVNQNTLSAAHFLGAKGLSDYMKTGYISPQAAAANGGEENVRRIVQGRLGGQTMPASGAVQPVAAPGAAPAPVAPQDMGEFAGVDRAVAEQAKLPQPQYTEQQFQANMEQLQKEQHINNFLQAQNDPREMLRFLNDDTAPQELRTQMEKTYYETRKSEYDIAKTQDKFKQALTNGDNLTATKMLSNKGPEGSMAKMLIFGLLGIKPLYEAELAKLDLPGKWAGVTNADGTETGMIQYSTAGKPLSGIKSDGTAMTDQELVAFASQGGTKRHTEGTLHQFKAEDGTMHVVETRQINGRNVYYDSTAGKALPGAPADMQPVGRVDQLERMGDQAAKTAMDKMRTANTQAATQNARLPYTEDQIIEAGRSAKAAVLSGRGVPAIAGAAPTVAGNVKPTPLPATTGTTAPVPVSPEQAAAAPAPATVAASADQPYLSQGYTQQAIDQARAIATYQKPMPTGLGATNKFNRDVVDLVNKINPQYDGQKYKENSKIINDFTPGGTAGKSLVAMGTAVNHIGDLRPLITALNNKDLQGANKIYNDIKKWTGDPNVTNIESVGPAVAAEIQKTFVSSGGGTGAERDELAKAFSTARSPQQLEGAVKMYENLMVGKLTELEKQYARTGRKDFWTNVVQDPRLKDMADIHNAERAARENKPVSGTTKTGIKFKVITE